MSTDFGDIELADAWDLAPPAADQVAYRLHELRRQVNQLTGRDTGDWRQLPHRDQDLMMSLAVVAVEWIILNEPDNPARLAQAVHDARRDLSAGAIPPWDELAGDQRQIAIDLMRLITTWIARQGPW